MTSSSFPGHADQIVRLVCSAVSSIRRRIKSGWEELDSRQSSHENENLEVPAGVTDLFSATDGNLSRVGPHPNSHELSHRRNVICRGQLGDHSGEDRNTVHLPSIAMAIALQTASLKTHADVAFLSLFTFTLNVR